MLTLACRHHVVACSPPLSRIRSCCRKRSLSSSSKGFVLCARAAGACTAVTQATWCADESAGHPEAACFCCREKRCRDENRAVLKLSRRLPSPHAAQQRGGAVAQEQRQGAGATPQAVDRRVGLQH